MGTRTHVFINYAAFANYMGNWASTCLKDVFAGTLSSPRVVCNQN